MTVHPARIYDYWILCNGLQRAIEAGHVHRQTSGSLSIYCYTKQCVYERAWTPITKMARGLIIDHEAARVVATPFPKFFNVGEGDHVSIPDLPFEVFEKLDGSLIILFWHDGQWRTATKGSFQSDQAMAASNWLAGFNLDALVPGYTYLFEWCSPDNRIVVPYDQPELVLLSIYLADGCEVPHALVTSLAGWFGWRAAMRYHFDSISDLIAHAKALPSTQEGFVMRFHDGTRLKVKGEEYCRIHRMISRCTPLALWEMMRAGDDLEALRRDLPEEFWSDFDAIEHLLDIQLYSLIREAKEEAHTTVHLTDKQIGLMEGLKHKSLVFTLRKYGGGNLTDYPRSREALYRAIRPTGNKLEGYMPSRSMNLVMEEAA
jgi:RNA ligase